MFHLTLVLGLSWFVRRLLHIPLSCEHVWEGRERVSWSHRPLCSEDTLLRNPQRSVSSHRLKPCPTASRNSSTCLCHWCPEPTRSFTARRNREVNGRETASPVTVGCLLTHMCLGNAGLIFLLTELLRAFQVQLTRNSYYSCYIQHFGQSKHRTPNFFPLRIPVNSEVF